MLAANAQLHARTGGAAALGGDPTRSPTPVLVERDERVFFKDARFR
jgi:hypothetical protein